MLYNNVSEGLINTVEVKVLMDAPFDFIKHSKDDAVYFCMYDNQQKKCVFCENGTATDEDVYPYLSRVLKKGHNKKFKDCAVFFRKADNKYGFEILDAIHCLGLRYYYLTQKELKDLFNNRRCILAKKHRCALKRMLSRIKCSQEQGQWVGITTNRLCDRLGNPIRVRI